LIVDTSALVAVAFAEAEHEPILDALLNETGFVPAPVLVEYRRVMSLAGNAPSPAGELLLQRLLERRLSVEPFGSADAHEASAANAPHGSGNGRGGTLNLLDLMVYGMGRRMNLPILCTGRDFAATGIAIHPASRSW
jgi:ribonuclease VapC